jgi:hypothetical protein
MSSSLRIRSGRSHVVLGGVRRRAAHPRAGARSVELAGRDLELLRWVSEQYAIRADQLEVWLGRGLRTTQRVAATLTAAGLAHSQRLLFDEPAWLWLTPAGQRLAGTGFRPWTPQPVLLSHIASVNEVRLHVQSRSPSSEWVCERELARGSDRDEHLPDAVVLDGGRSHAIEVELTPKSRPRLLGNLERLCSGHDVVMYFCSPPVRRQLERVRDEQRLPELVIRDLPTRGKSRELLA